MTDHPPATDLSPWDLPEYNELDGRAKRFQRLSRFLLVFELSLEVGAGFIAIWSGRSWVLTAMVMLLIAVLAGMFESRVGWTRQWHESRSRAELLVSAFWRRSYPSLWSRDDEDAGPEAQAYLVNRVMDQQGYYSRRAAEYIARARVARVAIWGLYATCALVAALEAAGKLDADFVGPMIALVASVRIWSESHEWERTAGIYAHCSSFLVQQGTRMKTIIASGSFPARELATILERVEDQLASEADRWLALNNFELFDERKYGGERGGPVPDNILEMDAAWSLVQGQDLYVPSSSPVPAKRLDAEFDWSNENGERLTGSAGDWILGEGEDRWSVIDSVFRETYREVGAGLYEKHAPVHAVKVSDALSLITLEGAITLAPGDWLVCNLSGECWGMSDNQFTAKYTREPDAKK